MSGEQPGPVTQLLQAAGEGDGAAREKIWAMVYSELHRLAQQQLAGDALRRGLQPTALVHEAYLRLVGGAEVTWSNRRHFFAAAAQAMRRIRIEDARRQHRLKRGGGQRPAALLDDPAQSASDPLEMLAIDEALHKLEQQDPRKAEIVTLRFFAGLTVDETARVLEISPRTVDAEWRFAKAWFHRELNAGERPPGTPE
ncbi:MAG: sigma-70 family RNA polymerase sigma factor [Phycisphaerae bacterium]|jgi:RNA polymerase sigma factor (TIGR02999 family)|nr:sigma-70 family RNA polymerase sigma factor [Phycisphaerae bacterium]HOO16427.1 sigma-70 family RNA polymerase sigma factor [Phycisphaerae bacterium]HPC22571.1 sigma-70 family RNA polymerase sigma factor [Phycisphaerae bacterium]HRS28517.1 sigma-70 family RNA polymerase sigma factor [Phycisphaerae bacterium]HRT42334.1 sigma-70 family RNA polymerase sigma factor [Phycisphaerae bacterium]